MKESLFLLLLLYFSICSFPLVYKFLALSPTYTHLSSCGQSLHSNSYCTLVLRQLPPWPRPSKQARQSTLAHPGNPLGLGRCTSFLIVLPPISTILNFKPSSASFSAISLRSLASSPCGVAGIKIGAMQPPFEDQLYFFLLLFILLSSCFQHLGLCRGLIPFWLSSVILS